MKKVNDLEVATLSKALEVEYPEISTKEGTAGFYLSKTFSRLNDITRDIGSSFVSEMMISTASRERMLEISREMGILLGSRIYFDFSEDDQSVILTKKNNLNFSSSISGKVIIKKGTIINFDFGEIVVEKDIIVNSSSNSIAIPAKIYTERNISINFKIKNEFLNDLDNLEIIIKTPIFTDYLLIETEEIRSILIDRMRIEGLPYDEKIILYIKSIPFILDAKILGDKIYFLTKEMNSFNLENIHNIRNILFSEVLNFSTSKLKHSISPARPVEVHLSITNLSSFYSYEDIYFLISSMIKSRGINNPITINEISSNLNLKPGSLDIIVNRIYFIDHYSQIEIDPQDVDGFFFVMAEESLVME